MTAQPRVRCPAPDELERSYWSRGGDLDAHLITCAACAKSWDEIERLAAGAAELETPAISAEGREQLRTAVLAGTEADAVAPEPRRRLTFAAAAAVVAIAAGLLLYLSLDRRDDLAISIETPAAAEHRGAVSSDSLDASYALASAQPDEVVRLSNGSIEVKVASLDVGERFRVLTDDAEIEVRGTAFRVTAIEGKLVSVSVSEGLVVVRAATGERELAAGDRWELLAARGDVTGPDEVVDPEPIRRAPRPRKIQVLHGPDAGRARVPTDYEEGWSHLRGNRYPEAAAAFDRATRSEASGVDALYWASIAHFRAGQRDRARALLLRFLHDHASDRRQPEVAVMLGWLEVDRKRFDAARRLFEIGTRARAEKVRRSAEAGLEALGTREPEPEPQFDK